MTKLLSLDEAAKFCGVTASSVTEAARVGKLRRAGRGQYAVADLVEWRAAATRSSELVRKATDAAKKAAGGETSSGASEAPDGLSSPALDVIQGGKSDLAGAGSVLLRAKTQAEVYRAKERELEYKRLAGSLIDRDQVKRDAATATRLMVTRLRNFPSRLGPMLATLVDEGECIKVVEAEVVDLIRELQEDVAAM